MFAKALYCSIKTLSHFPSISEMNDIIGGIVGHEFAKKNLQKKDEQFVFIPKVAGYKAAHEGLFMGYEERGEPSKFGLEFCKIAEHEFYDVYYEWKNGHVHPAANRITGYEIPTLQK